MLNTQVYLASRPNGIPQADNFAIRRAAVPDLRDGQFLVRNDVLSVEPAMRGWVSAVANYSTPVGIGEVMRSFSAGEVVASKHAQYAVGDKVMGMLGWQDYAVADPSMVTRKVRETDLPLSLSLGILGLNGVTAYFGLLDLGRPRPGDTVVVSTAAGSVGSAVGQIAALSGCPRSVLPAARPSAGHASRPSATTPRSTTRRPTSMSDSLRRRRTASTSISTIRRAPSATPCSSASPSARASSSAAPRLCRAGTRRRWGLASSGTFWSSARPCRAC